MSLKLVLIFFSILQVHSMPQQKWSVEKKKIQINSTTVTTLEFNKGKKRQVYQPERGSLWVLNIVEAQVNKKQYFITGWSQGSRNLLFRVFDPEISNSPICDAVSFSDNSKLRQENGYLQILITPDMNMADAKKTKKSYWKNCRKIN